MATFDTLERPHNMGPRRLAYPILNVLLLLSLAAAQPSPQVQQRITSAIKTAATEKNIDYTAFVNPFIGTGKYLHLHLALMI